MRNVEEKEAMDEEREERRDGESVVGEKERGAVWGVTVRYGHLFGWGGVMVGQYRWLPYGTRF